MGSERLAAHCAVLLALGAAAGCTRDVVVGVDPNLALTGAGDASSSPASALTAVARDGETLFVSGWASDGSVVDATSDLWMGRLDADGNERGGARVDVEGQADTASGVLAVGAGAWVVAGSATTAAGRRGWLRRLSAQDAPEWTRIVEGSDGATDVEIAAVVQGGADTFFVGGNDAANGTRVGWVTRLDASGNPIWRHKFNSTNHPSAIGSEVVTIAVTVADHVLMGGRRPPPQGSGAPILVQVSNAGDIWASRADFGAPVSAGTVRGIVPEANRDAIVCVEADGSLVMARVDPALGLLSSAQHRDPRGAISVGGCVGTSDGAVLIVGSVDVGGSPEPWAAKYERASLAQRWQRAIPSEQGAAFAVAVAADDAGGGFAVGRTAIGGRRWFARVAP